MVDKTKAKDKDKLKKCYIYDPFSRTGYRKDYPTEDTPCLSDEQMAALKLQRKNKIRNAGRLAVRALRGGLFRNPFAGLD